MDRSDWREIGLWAGVAAIIAGGALTPRLTTAVDAGGAARPAVRAKDWSISASVRPGKEPRTALLDLSVENRGERDGSLTLSLALQRVEFAGDPFSRVAVPTDSKPPVTVWSRAITATAKAHAAWRETITMACGPAATNPRARYVVMMTTATGSAGIATFTPSLWHGGYDGGK